MIWALERLCLVMRIPVALPFDDDHDLDMTFKTILSDLWYTFNAKVFQPEIAASLHVRWCPTGPLTFLPLHGAGDYTKQGRGHRIFDFIISSYIPTLSSVIRPPHDVTDTSKISILAVACSSTKGQLPIPGTKTELAHLEKHALSSSSGFTSITEKDATVLRVLKEMKAANWTALASYSPTSPPSTYPSGTRISICLSDATGYEKLPSEAMHLAAGMLLAGYRSVIATMWSIQDRHAPQVADDVYGYLLRDEKRDTPDYKESALALHLAVKRLRERVGEDKFLAWMPYIHIGPKSNWQLVLPSIEGLSRIIRWQGRIEPREKLC
ncbi:hypothetical protein BDZ89DRAFT_1141573 [Hymenopellis radicata]|nr:hypothetical protein BDZ89DRAFT_1141573 [Hymenopellis radicata]